MAATAWFVDLIYIDSAHERGETIIEIHLYWQLVRPGGLLMGDDYRDFPAVRSDVDEFARCEGLTIISGGMHGGLGSPNTWASRKPLDAARGMRGTLGVPRPERRT